MFSGPAVRFLQADPISVSTRLWRRSVLLLQPMYWLQHPRNNHLYHEKQYFLGKRIPKTFYFILKTKLLAMVLGSALLIFFVRCVQEQLQQLYLGTAVFSNSYILCSETAFVFGNSILCSGTAHFVFGNSILFFQEQHFVFKNSCTHVFIILLASVGDALYQREGLPPLQDIFWKNMEVHLPEGRCITSRIWGAVRLAVSDFVVKLK